MKRIIEKSVSILICLAIIISTLAASVNASTNKGGTDIPLVYLQGQGCNIYKTNDDGSRSKVYPIELSEEEIKDIVLKYKDVFIKAVLTQKWDEFCDVLYNVVAPLYDGVALDSKGNPKYNSDPGYSWHNYPMSNKLSGDKYSSTYDYYYDWRIDPFETAKDLHEYIEAIIEKTGCEKVALLGRCLGASIASAYMQMYDGEYISDYIMYANAANGVSACSKIFAGKIYIDSNSVERYLYDVQLGEDELLNDLIRAFVTVSNGNGLLDLACWSFNNVYSKIYMNIVPRITRNSYATFVSFWSMVKDEDYDEAKYVTFSDTEDGEYDEFIEKIDRYHYDVQLKLPELIHRWESKGIRVYNVLKYGFQTVPVIEDSDKLSDSICTVEESSLGATTANTETNLSDKYIKSRIDEGYEKYISPDRMIDASTCVLPERTWFIKNISHMDFPNTIDEFLNALVNEHLTVSDNDTYSQFMVYNNESSSLLKMSSENCITSSHVNVTFWSALIKLINSIFEYIKRSI